MYKDFTSFLDLTEADLLSLVDAGLEYEKLGGAPGDFYKNKYIGLLFYLPSTRTRLSFERAIQMQGGHVGFYTSESMQLKNGESLADTAAVLSQYLDALVIRNYDMSSYGLGRKNLMEFVENASIPVINALDCMEHPCQVLADLITLKSRWQKEFKRKKVLVTWGYSHRQKSLGVPHSWLLGSSLLGCDLRIAHPSGFELDPTYVDMAKENAKRTGATLEFSNDLMEASEGVDCIYVKNWKSLKFESEYEKSYKEEIRDKWKITDACFEQANDGAVYMDCLPSIAEEEASTSVRKGPQSIILPQAKNRIYANQAILSRSIGLPILKGDKSAA